MWVCVNCGHVFEEPACWDERHGFDHGPFERLSGCPRCFESYVEAHRCDCCGEWITGSYIKLESGERICDDCYMPMDLGDENY
jgi:hypothetical protein